jgi:hypothetical protein
MNTQPYETIKITRYVTKAEQGSYIKIPFEMPQNVEYVKIEYSYLGDNKNADPIGNKTVLDLAVVDCFGNDVGATGSSYKCVTFGETTSSNGYKSLRLTAGDWHIILGIYLVAGEGVEVSYKITFFYKTMRWFVGDTHIHTTNSDGYQTYSELAAQAKKKGLDFLIFTDHNNLANRIPYDKDITLINGVEHTHFKGHMNFLGVEKPYDGTYAVNSFEELKALAAQGKQRGALVTINHPLNVFETVNWNWDTDFDYDGIEVWNGIALTDPFRNIKFWENEVKKGKKPFLIGGSDYHGQLKCLLARPCVAVLAPSRSQDDLLQAIKAGNLVVLANPKVAPLVIASKAKQSTVSIKTEKLRKGRTLLLFNENGEIFRYKAKKTAPFSHTIDASGSLYVRAEIRRKPPLVHALMDLIYRKLANKKEKGLCKEAMEILTNPVYFS